MSSWKYAGSCAIPNGTLTYSNFPNGEVKAVLGMDSSSKGMWWYPTLRSNVEKDFAPFNYENMFLTIEIGQMNFLVTLLRTW